MFTRTAKSSFSAFVMNLGLLNLPSGVLIFGGMVIRITELCIRWLQTCDTDG